jgi:hypothetical protein
LERQQLRPASFLLGSMPPSELPSPLLLRPRCHRVAISPWLQRWTRLGFTTVLHFIELPSADFALARVLSRVLAGGHHIPEQDVRRRFDRGKRLFVELYKDAFDISYHWFSDEDGLRLLSKRPDE